MKADYESLSDEEKRNLDELRENSREKLRRNVTEAMGKKLLAEDKVEIEIRNQEIAQCKLTMLKYEWALKKVGYDPDKVKNQEVDTTQTPFELEQAKRKSDRISYQRDRDFYENEISKLKIKIYDLERACIPKPK